MGKFLYYGFSGKIFDGEDIKKAVEILSSGGITDKKYVSLYSDGDGFSEYAEGCCCFIVSNNLPAKKIRRIDDRHFYKLQRFFQFSSFNDEWRIKRTIPLSSIVGIGLPMEQVKIYDWENVPYFQKHLQELLMMAKDLKLDIVDSSDSDFSKEYEERKRISNAPIYNVSLERLVDGSYCSKYFYHGLSRNADSIEKMYSILTTGGIKCKRLLNYRASYGYNEYDFVSLCKKYPDRDYDESSLEAFYSYVFNSFCFIISDDIPAVKMHLDDIGLNNLDDEFDFRVSDMFDEWQVREMVPLSSIIGIGIPLKGLKKLMRKLKRDDFEKLRKILLLATELGLDIVDSSESHFAEKYEKMKKINPGKVYQAKIGIYTSLGEK